MACATLWDQLEGTWGRGRGAAPVREASRDPQSTRLGDLRSPGSLGTPSWTLIMRRARRNASRSGARARRDALVARRFPESPNKNLSLRPAPRHFASLGRDKLRLLCLAQTAFVRRTCIGRSKQQKSWRWLWRHLAAGAQTADPPRVVRPSFRAAAARWRSLWFVSFLILQIVLDACSFLLSISRHDFECSDLQIRIYRLTAGRKSKFLRPNWHIT